jgi:cell division transport system ATP-binding protein
MITFDAVHKKYSSEATGLENVSFQIENNEFVFLTGPSGAGKTTILKLIMRMFLPSSGSILVEGEDITDKNFKKTIELRRGIGIVFQDFKILYDKNIFENIALALRIADMPHSVITEEVDKVLSLVGLENKKAMFPIQLSAGELQRVAIARAIIGDRKIILADEPTGNLDPKTSWEIMKLFKKLEHDHTIIIATHNVDIVNSFKKTGNRIKKRKDFL